MRESYLSLDEFAGGALLEKFNIAMDDVLENLSDLNTNPANQRKLTIELNFTTNDSRQTTDVEILTKTKLTHKNGVTTSMLMDRDKNGKLVAGEIGKQVQGQRYMTEEDGNLKADEEEEEATKGIKLVK